MKEIAEDIFYVGVNDTKIDLFEGMYNVPDGVTYNSYVIKDNKIAVMDSVDAAFCGEWLANIEKVLQGAKPDYIIVQHMEPDHSACVAAFAEKYPEAKVVGNQKTFVMLGEYFGEGFPQNRLTVTDGDILDLGKHTLQFVFTPMVHWPEVMLTYDKSQSLLFSADAFGKFGISDGEDWRNEARRYYIGIVGKYGVQVKS
ncbi:MAG: MBL fold metallo-hydrolase, partial [Clostridia bacterium]|nr:MBL fold metallo-hydrolase [Clostridia bacterium]